MGMAISPETVATTLVVAASCLAYFIHVLVIAPKVYATGAFAIIFMSGFIQSVSGGVIYIIEDRTAAFDATSLPGVITDLAILTSGFASLLFGAALLEHVRHHWLGRFARHHRLALSLTGAAITAAELTAVVFFPSFKLAMYLSAPSGVVLIASISLLFRQSWARTSPLAWMHRPTLWALAGLLVLLMSSGESVLSSAWCGGGAEVTLFRCPLVSTFLDTRTVYNLMRIVGYGLLWYGGKQLCTLHNTYAPAGTPLDVRTLSDDNLPLLGDSRASNASDGPPSSNQPSAATGSAAASPLVRPRGFTSTTDGSGVEHPVLLVDANTDALWEATLQQGGNSTPIPAHVDPNFPFS